jgi:hypothetical protein
MRLAGLCIRCRLPRRVIVDLAMLASPVPKGVCVTCADPRQVFWKAPRGQVVHCQRSCLNPNVRDTAVRLELTREEFDSFVACRRCGKWRTYGRE